MMRADQLNLRDVFTCHWHITTCIAQTDFKDVLLPMLAQWIKKVAARDRRAEVHAEKSFDRLSADRGGPLQGRDRWRADQRTVVRGGTLTPRAGEHQPSAARIWHVVPCWRHRRPTLPQSLVAVALDDVQKLQRRARRPALTALPLAHAGVATQPMRAPPPARPGNAQRHRGSRCSGAEPQGDGNVRASDARPVAAPGSAKPWWRAWRCR